MPGMFGNLISYFTHKEITHIKSDCAKNPQSGPKIYKMSLAGIYRGSIRQYLQNWIILGDRAAEAVIVNVTVWPLIHLPLSWRDWIHLESLASDEVWQALLDLSRTNMGHSTGTVTETAQVSWLLCLASLGLGGIGFTLKVWQAMRSGKC